MKSTCRWRCAIVFHETHPVGPVSCLVKGPLLRKAGRHTSSLIKVAGVGGVGRITSPLMRSCPFLPRSPTFLASPYELSQVLLGLLNFFFFVSFFQMLARAKVWFFWYFWPPSSFSQVPIPQVPASPLREWLPCWFNSNNRTGLFSSSTPFSSS